MAAVQPTTGVLLANLGSPEAPTARAVRPFLREFLWDPRVVELPRWKWWLILNLIVLTTRPRASAALYRTIWTDAGSPLIELSKRLRSAVADELGERFEVVLGMRYGRPSIAEALAPLRRRGCNRLVCLPLYPQYSATTTASTFDALFDELKRWRRMPGLVTIDDYCDDPGYIAALAASVRARWTAEGEAEKLLLSFHGIPCRYAEAGDPYVERCRRTASALRAALGLDEVRAPIAFQSRFGRDPWVGPATDEMVRELAASGLTSLDVVCPGFAVDCLETLEEIGTRAREDFIGHGGKNFRLIPCLNDGVDHARALARLVSSRGLDR